MLKKKYLNTEKIKIFIFRQNLIYKLNYFIFIQKNKSVPKLLQVEVYRPGIRPFLYIMFT